MREGDREAMPEEHFPNGKYMVCLKSMATMEFRGENIRPTEYGVFFIHKVPGTYDRVSFFPWYMVQRIYQTGG